MTTPFRIKICGVRSTNDVDMVARAGADAVGLNFYAPSVRSLNPSDPATVEINQTAMKHGLVRIGLFVNEPIKNIRSIVESLQLDWIQLHGDESVSHATELLDAGHQVLRAIRLPHGPLAGPAIDAAIGPWADLPVALLLDADAGGAFGGGGNRLDWPSIRRWSSVRSAECASWTLAGGLTPENVAEAIRSSGATSVDVASGVESPKGKKNKVRISRFAAQTGWSNDAN